MSDLDVTARLDNLSPSLGRWHTTGFDRNDLGHAVSMVHFVAYPNAENRPGLAVPPTNHWGIFLAVTAGRSVRVDVEPGATTSSGAQQGVVVIRSKTYNVTHSGCCVISAAVTRAITVQDVLFMIMHRRRDQYLFDVNLEGCRRWTYTIAYDLGETRIITETSTSEVAKAIVKYWPSPLHTLPVPREMDNGKFFYDDGQQY